MDFYWVAFAKLSVMRLAIFRNRLLINELVQYLHRRWKTLIPYHGKCCRLNHRLP